MQNANVKSSFEKGTLRFSLTGEIDHHSAVHLRQKMDEAIFFHRPKVAVIELAALDFMDSSGLGLILGRYNKMKQLDGKLILENPTRSIEKILRLSGADKLIEIQRNDFTEDVHNEKRKDQ